MSTSVASPSISSPIPTFRPRIWVQTSMAAFISLTIALYFWIDSRYPALLKKLHRGKGIQTTGALSFDALMPVTPAMSLITRIGHTTVNWMWTNRIGMTFGICFGVAMLTLLSTLPRIRFKSAAGNTLLGMVAGVPLAICANCVAPIGRSLFVAGGEPEYGCGNHDQLADAECRGAGDGLRIISAADRVSAGSGSAGAVSFGASHRS